MVTITDIRITRHRIELDPPLPAAWDRRPRRHFESVIVRVDTDAGISGVAGGDAMAGFDAYRDLFIGQPAGDIERHHAVLDNIAFHGGRCWPLDAALHDLAGRLAGQPVWRLLGGNDTRVPVYASTAVLREPGAMVEQVARIREAGFRAVKLRVGRPRWRDDLAVVEAVRAAHGDAVEIMVDCNQAWRMPWDTGEPWSLRQALPRVRELARLGVYWVEEPLHRADLKGMAALRQQAGVRIAAGEMQRETWQLDAMIGAGCVDVLQPDCVLTGGITGLARVAVRARDAGIEFSPHTWGDGLALAANLQLVAGTGAPPWLEFPFDPPQWTPARRDFALAGPLEARDGFVEAAEVPGLGVELDEARLAATRVA